MTTFETMWHDLLPVGRNSDTGGYRRFVWSDAERACREWFVAEAGTRGLDVHDDRNGNLWAWWGDPDTEGPGLVIGSHLDSVPEGGAFDGPLGVVSSFAALDIVRLSGAPRSRPIAVAAFSDEEGARFGVACAGSRLLTGQLTPERALALTDETGDTMSDVLTRAGRDPSALGPDDDALQRIAAFVELHIEQGRSLVHSADPVGIASEIWPHGRWRFEFSGRADHAGTTKLVDREDPMLPFARSVLRARDAATEHGALTTFGKVHVEPNGTNAIPSLVTAWLDARAESELQLRAAVDRIIGTSGAQVTEESWSPEVDLLGRLTDRVRAVLPDAPLIPTGAGHDAGILATAGVPSAMLFVRNPTGISHSPHEHAQASDCLAGITALAAVVTDLATAS